MLGEYLWDLVKLWFYLLAATVVYAVYHGSTPWFLEYLALPITAPALLLYVGWSSLPTVAVSGPMAAVIVLLGLIWLELVLHGAKK